MDINDRCIYKYTSKSAQLILTIDALDLDTPSMKLILQKYDRNKERGDRIIAQVDTYLPVPVFLRLKQDVFSGYLLKMQRARETDPYFEERGGFERQGSLVARKLALIPDTYGKTSFALYGEYAPGVRGENNMISPREGCKAISRVYLPMPDEKLKELLLIGGEYISAYVQMDMARRLESVRGYRRQLSKKEA